MRSIVMGVITFMCCWGASAQEIRLKRTPMLDRFFSRKSAISDITEFPNYWNSDNLIVEKRVHKPSKLFPKLVVTDSGFYLLTNAAGFVYKAIEKEKDSIRFIAVDSTFYVGYNGSAIRFSYRNVLYSLGGYGFWKNNGYLLHFMQGKDWQIKTLNFEVPVILKMHSFDPKKGLVYYFSPRYDDQATGKLYNQQKFYVLDVEQQRNQELGRLNEKYTNLISTQLLINVPSLNGVLVEDRFVIFLVSIPENKVYKLINQQIIDQFKYGLINVPCGYTYADGEYLYYSSTSNIPVDSLRLSLSDFELLKEPLFVRKSIWETLSFEYWMLIINIFLMFVVGFVFSLYKKKQSQKVFNSVDTIDLEEQSIIVQDEKLTLFYFTDFEKLIVKTMLEKGSNFNVNEINEILGLKKKTPDFQKKIRTEAINRINVKYRQMAGLTSDLIVRVRSNEDKRFILYSIPHDVEEVLKWLN